MAAIMSGELLLSTILIIFGTIVLAYYNLNVKKYLDDDLIIKTYDNDRYTQKKHIKARKSTLVGVTFIVTGLLIPFYQELGSSVNYISHFLIEFNSREKAVIFWIIITLSCMFLNEDIRKALLTLFKSLPSTKILIPLFFM